MIITIVGQLAANLGMVLIVGAALAVVHQGRHDLRAVSALIIAVLGSVGLIVGIAVRRGRGSDLSSIPPRAAVVQLASYHAGFAAAAGGGGTADHYGPGRQGEVGTASPIGACVRLHRGGRHRSLQRFAAAYPSAAM